LPASRPQGSIGQLLVWHLPMLAIDLEVSEPASAMANQGSDSTSQRQRCSRKTLSLLPPDPTGFARTLNRCLFDRGDGSLKLIGIGSTDGQESRCSQDAVPGGQVGLLLEDVLVFRRLLGVLDLADLLALGSVGDVLSLLLASVPGSSVGAHGCVEQAEGAPDP
jgi:hypothetical protein